MVNHLHRQRIKISIHRVCCAFLLIDGAELEDDQLVIVTGTTPRPDQAVGMDGRFLSRCARPTLRVRSDRVV